jgi:hypothetical protein
MYALPQTWAALLNHPEAVPLRVLGFVASDRSELDRCPSPVPVRDRPVASRRQTSCPFARNIWPPSWIFSSPTKRRFSGSRAPSIYRQKLSVRRGIGSIASGTMALLPCPREKMSSHVRIAARTSVVTAAPHRLQVSELSRRVASQCSPVLRAIGSAVSLECRRSHGNASAWPAKGATE